MYHVPLALKEVKMQFGRKRVRLPSLLYADEVVLYGESEKDL